MKEQQFEESPVLSSGELAVPCDDDYASSSALFPPDYDSDSSIDSHQSGTVAVDFGESATATISYKKRSLRYRAIKRIIDIIISIIVIVISIIPMIVISIILRFESRGFPIYRQKRVGQFGQPINILKLRTMVVDSDDVYKYLNKEQLSQWLQERKVDNDPRVTRLGSFFRKTSLDELPQFFNVLAGSMSVVGPRPVVQEELSAYGSDAEIFLGEKPGITGWWQVSARNDASYMDGSRQDLELYYIKNASINFDIKIMLSTFRAVFLKTGK